MSIKAVLWAFEAKVESTPQFAVLVVLADYADAAGRAWPSNETICRRTKLSERTVRSTMAELASLELIKVTRRQRATNVATLAIPNMLAEDVTNAPKVDGIQVETPPKAAKASKFQGATFADQEFPEQIPDRQMSPLRGQMPPFKGANVAPEPVIEPIKEPLSKIPPKPPIKPKAQTSALDTLKEGKGLREKEAVPSEAEIAQGFAAFYAAFPVKAGKSAAERNFRLAAIGALPEVKVPGSRPVPCKHAPVPMVDMIRGARGYAEDVKRLPHGQTAKYAQGWLTGRRWRDYEDGKEDVVRTATSKPSRYAWADDILSPKPPIVSADMFDADRFVDGDVA